MAPRPLTARTAALPADHRGWLVKSEPEAYSWADFVREGGTAWTGVRNHQARQHLQAMARGDLVLFYHSVSEKAVVGLAKVTRAAYPDPTADDPAWFCVNLSPVAPLPRPVALAQIKAAPALAGLPLLRQSRLSVLPVQPAEWQALLVLAAL